MCCDLVYEGGRATNDSIHLLSNCVCKCLILCSITSEEKREKRGEIWCVKDKQIDKVHGNNLDPITAAGHHHLTIC